MNKKILKRVNRAVKHTTIKKSSKDMNIERAMFISTLV